jgi:acetate kinase
LKYIISLNCGTSSVKYAVFEQETLKERCRGTVERVMIDGTFIKHKVSGNSEALVYEKQCRNHTEAIDLVFLTLTGKIDPVYGVIKDLDQVAAVGHRVLHGGDKFTKSVRVTDEVKEKIREMFVFGPLHNPANLAGIEAIETLLPGIPQVAVFDTAFFQTLPEQAYLYGSPYEWYEKYRIRKYGFHGTSHLYISRRAAVVLGKKPSDTNLVTLHIGNGISLTAIRNGVAVDHTMGVTPLDGVMMGTRSGAVDPSIVAFICEKEGKTAKEVVDIYLNRKSGVFGFTGLTDMRDLMQKMDEGDEACRRAFESYCYKIRHYLSAYLGVLEYDVDAIVFAGGVGENDGRTRAKIASGFERIGLTLDSEKNLKTRGSAGETDLSAPGAKIRTLMIPTNEEQVLLEDVNAILSGTYDIHTKFRYSFDAAPAAAR